MTRRLRSALRCSVCLLWRCFSSPALPAITLIHLLVIPSDRAHASAPGARAGEQIELRMRSVIEVTGIRSYRCMLNVRVSLYACVAS